MLQCEACEASPGHYVAATENADRDGSSTIQRARVARYTWGGSCSFGRWVYVCVTRRTAGAAG